MEDEIIEGEVIEPGMCPDLDPWIAAEVKDFQQRMDEMKNVYLFAADHIRWSGYRNGQTRPETRKPSMGYMALHRWGKFLVSVGKRILKKYPTFEEMQDQEKSQTIRSSWPQEKGRRRAVKLSPPDLSRFGGK